MGKKASKASTAGLKPLIPTKKKQPAKQLDFPPSTDLLNDVDFVKRVNKEGEYAIRLHESKRPHFDLVIGTKDEPWLVDFVIIGQTKEQITKGIPKFVGMQAKLEDAHPNEYITNEKGVIEEGEYGAGKWHVVKRWKASIEKGKGHFNITIDNKRFLLFHGSKGWFMKENTPKIAGNKAKKNSENAGEMIAANATSLFALWAAGPNKEDLDDYVKDDSLAREMNITFENARKGHEVLAKLLLDNAKTVLHKNANWRLDEFLNAYLSDEDFKKYTEE